MTGLGQGGLPIPSDARAISAYTLAATGLLAWSLQTYVFKSGLPAPIAGSIYTLVPGIIGYLASHYTRQSTAPSATPTPTSATQASPPTETPARGSP